MNFFFILFSFECNDSVVKNEETKKMESSRRIKVRDFECRFIRIFFRGGRREKRIIYIPHNRHTDKRDIINEKIKEGEKLNWDEGNVVDRIRGRDWDSSFQSI